MARARKSKARPKTSDTRTEPVPKRTRADGRKVTTRQRLIDATIDIVRSEGPGALTTGRIANAAGIQQPGFYAHFKNVDACLAAAAEQINSYLVETDVKLRRARQGIPDTERKTESVERMKVLLGAWMENRRFAELFARCRYDQTAIGASCREATERARVALREDLWDLALQIGLRGRYVKEIELMASLLVNGFAAGLELLVAGTHNDLDAVAGALGRSQYYYVVGEFRRMLKEQQAANESRQATG
jgi:AcrR family transcriptional regulator